SGDYRYLWEAIAAYSPKNMKGWTFTADGLLGWEEHAAANGGTAKWYGVTAYAGYAMNDYVTFNARGEWFRDEGASRIGVDGNFYEATLGASIKPFPHHGIGQNLVVRPEARYD